MSIRPIALSIAAGLALTPAAVAQWVSFTDDTTNRLKLTTVPMNDTQEKDIGVCDLDHDGWPDVVVGRKVPFSNQGPRQALLLMNIGGVLTDKTQDLAKAFIDKFTDAREVVCADFTGDGWEDVVFANTFGQYPSFYRNLGKDGQGNWLGLKEESDRIPHPIGTPKEVIKCCAAWPGDIDGDEDLDIYFSNYNGGDDFLMVNDGTGNFVDQTAQRLGNYANSAFGTAVEFTDLDKDGDLDAIKCTTLYDEPPFSVGVFILWNDGTGKFNSIPFQTVPGTQSPYMFKPADLDNDTRTDIYVVQDPQDQVKFVTAISQHNVTFGKTTNVSSSRTSGFGGNTDVADIDQDGDLDVGVTPVDVDISNCGDSTFALLRNDGNGNLSDPWGSSQNIHTFAFDFAFVDINGDGCLDLFQGLCTGWRVLIQNECKPKECYADCDKSGSLDIDDFICYQTAFGLGLPAADCDQSGGLDVDDFICYQTMYGLGCP